MIFRIFFACIISLSLFNCKRALFVESLPANDKHLTYHKERPDFAKKQFLPKRLELSNLKIIEGIINQNPLYDELLSHGVQPSDIILLNSSFEKVFNFKNSRPKDQYTLYMTKNNELHRFVYENRSKFAYIAQKNESGNFDISKDAIKLEKRVVAKQFTIKSNIYNTITGNDEKVQLADMFVDIFSWDVNFYLDLRDGEKIKILMEKFYNKETFVDYGKILAAQYIGRVNTYTAFLFKHKSFDGYYDENGNALRKNFLKAPVKFARQTSGFCLRRFHPISKKYLRHTGVDYGAKMGTPIFATAKGTVSFSGWMKGYGRVIVISHENDYETYYGHCSKLLATKGKKIKQGELIARVGKTGFATGPHVHYEIRIKGNPVDPSKLKTGNGKPVPGRYLTKFNRMKQSRLHDMTTLLAKKSPAPDQNQSQKPITKTSQAQALPSL